MHIKGKDNIVSDALSRTLVFYEVNAIEFFPQAPHTQIDQHTLTEAAQRDEKYRILCSDSI